MTEPPGQNHEVLYTEQLAKIPPTHWETKERSSSSSFTPENTFSPPVCGAADKHLRYFKGRHDPPLNRTPSPKQEGGPHRLGPRADSRSLKADAGLGARLTSFQVRGRPNRDELRRQRLQTPPLQFAGLIGLQSRGGGGELMKRSERMGGPHTSRGVGERQVDSAGGVGWGGDSWIYPETER